MGGIGSPPNIPETLQDNPPVIIRSESADYVSRSTKNGSLQSQRYEKEQRHIYSDTQGYIL